MSDLSIGARPWAEVVALYSEFTDKPWGLAMHQLTFHLDARGYVAAGLYAATSMTELLLGTTTDLGKLPRLRIQPTNTDVRLTYEDGSPKPWSIAVDFAELGDRVERVLLKRARWFHNRIIIKEHP